MLEAWEGEWFGSLHKIMNKKEGPKKQTSCVFLAVILLGYEMMDGELLVFLIRLVPKNSKQTTLG